MEMKMSEKTASMQSSTQAYVTTKYQQVRAMQIET